MDQLSSTSNETGLSPGLSSGLFFIPSHTDSGISSSSNLQSAPSPHRRQRLRSLPLGRPDDLVNLFRHSFHMGSSCSEDEDHTKEYRGKAVDPKHGKMDSGIRGLLRRASVSLKNHTQPRRASHSHSTSFYDTSNTRPSTSSSAWHKLKNAASFRNSKNELLSYGYKDQGTLESFNDIDIDVPIPGNGNAPPIIPRGIGGEAARATAAAQNELLERTRQLHLEDSYWESCIDCESAVELSLPHVNLGQADEEIMAHHDNSIIRVDFIANLPTELALHILSTLDHYALAQAAEVSRTWYKVANTNSIWKEAFYREKSSTYAMGRPVTPGSGLGLPPMVPDKQWKDVYRARQQLEQNWTEGDAKAIYLNGHTDSIYCIQFDEHKIITGSRDRTIRIWDIHTYACLLVIGPPHVVSAPCLITSPEDGSLMHYATISDPLPYVCAHSIPDSISYPLHHDASILCLQYDAEILVTGSSDGTCIVYSINNNYQPIRQLAHHTAAVLDLAFDDKYIVTCSKDCTICVWDRATGDMLKQLHGHSGPINAVQMRGNMIVSCSGDFTVKLWNIDSGKNIRELEGHTKGLACSQLSEDSRYIASAGNDRVIRIWDANTGDCLRTIDAHENLVRSLHIDSVSGRLISGSYDQDIKVFDMESGELLVDFPKWHSSWVLGAKSDYRRIISTGQDKKILIMDFGMDIEGVEELESEPIEPRARRLIRERKAREEARTERARREDEERQAYLRILERKMGSKLAAETASRAA